jgi:hypothetical protein
MTTRIVLTALFLTLGACASTPDYVAAEDAAGYGYYSQRIEDDRYRVNFNGNRHTSYEETRNYALLRAAELTVAEGYDWFEIVDRESLTTEQAPRAPAARFGYTEYAYVEERCGLLGCTRRARPSAFTATSLEFDATRPTTRYMHSLEIVMGKDELPEGGHAYDAREVMRTVYSAT